MRGRDRNRRAGAREGGMPGGSPSPQRSSRQYQPYIPRYYPETREQSSQSAQNFKIYVGFGVLGLATTVGTILLVRHFVKKGTQKTTEVKTTQTGQPANFAKLLQMAFQNDNWFGWGTNLDLVDKVFNALPSQSFYKQVQNEYDKMTNGRSLNADLSDELDIKEYTKVLGILQTKKLR
jgi:hypothetical protein